ncbi:DUF349 domain-containing protein [Hymenobacter sp. PAMC 26628]|uniref:DUF349 domain-containing protein n=1 Tax=Hymenobacter sp. PAMC 26628 TaxID=1484118 RepID=UPI000770301E|nr:DUF349 domain-containing protein [Hymenobacter sp. PAMC 26628]AMJ65579.1 hypothetical protein AXW84_09150 [Hymenobacter sp. PAMC 26628]
MSTEQTPQAPQSGGPQPGGEDRMSILERRLAEIQAQNAAPAPEPAPSAAPEPGTPEAAAAAETAHHVPDAVTVDGADVSAPQARATAHYGDAAPDAAALPAVEAVEEAAPVAEAPVVEAEAPVAEAPHGHTVEEAAPLPTVALHSAEELLDAPEGVATLPTSSETPLDDAPADPAALALPEVPAVGAQPEANAAEAEEAHALSAAEGAPAAPVAEAPAAPVALESPDFTALDLPAQAQYLVQELRGPNAQRNRKTVLDLVRQYEANVGHARSAARQKFAEGGADAEAFAFQQPEGQLELNKALQEFREGRAKNAKAEDASRGDNLAKKQQLLDQLRQLVEAAETKDSSAKLKALQGEWKSTGPVPQTDSQPIWDTYHGLLDIYYSKQGRFLEMKDLDRRRNQEAKENLIKRAEGLMALTGINKALDELTKLHEDWKNIGPVPNDQRESLWQRFIAASDALHQRRKEFSDGRSVQEKANLVVKKALLERIQPFAEFDTDRVNLWRSKTDELQEIKAEWEAAGLVPRAQADALNKQYWAAYKAFFNRKNDFFKSLDNEKSANVKAKQALIDQAEEAQNNPDAEAARAVVMRIQKEWKDVGRVPDKLADKLWHRFRNACDAVFDRPKHEARQREEKATASSGEQLAYLEQVAQQVGALGDENPATLEGFRAVLADWSEAFDAAGTGDRSEEQLLGLLGQYLAAVPGLSYAERAELLFQAEVARLKARPQAQQQLTRKEMALRKEINELENDHATLQTNLAFFARSKNAAQLREEYEGRMAEGQKRIDVLKKQLKTVRA